MKNEHEIFIRITDENSYLTTGKPKNFFFLLNLSQ